MTYLLNGNAKNNQRYIYTKPEVKDAHLNPFGV